MSRRPYLWAIWLIGIMLAACTTSPSATQVPTAAIPIIPTATSLGQGLASGGDGPNWSGLNLTGRLIVALGNQGVQQINLATGAVSTIFLPPEDSWLTAASTSADGRWIALAYGPPPPEGEVQLGYTSIYLLPGECITRAQACGGEDLIPAILREGPHEAYFSPLWSPSGDFLYLAHFVPSSSETNSSFKYTLERVSVTDGLPSGKPEVVLEDALWPAINAAGDRLVYVYSDPEEFTNHLMWISPDDPQPVELLGPEDFEALDAPFYSADGNQVFFSAVGDGPTAGRPEPPAGAALPAWLDWLLGTGTAEASGFEMPMAHNVPSDWWVMPANGGTPTRLTRVYDTGLFGDLSPDGAHIAYLSASGVFVMDTDGGNLQQLLDLSAFGTLEWVD